MYLCFGGVVIQWSVCSGPILSIGCPLFRAYSKLNVFYCIHSTITRYSTAQVYIYPENHIPGCPVAPAELGCADKVSSQPQIFLTVTARGRAS